MAFEPDLLQSKSGSAQRTKRKKARSIFFRERTKERNEVERYPIAGPMLPDSCYYKDMTNDDDLTYFFKNFESILGSPERREIDNILTGLDFRVFSEYLIKDIREIQERLDSADDEYLLYVCEHIYSITEWIELMVGSMSKLFSDAWEKVFDEHFGDKFILKNIYDKSFEKWISNKSGQHKLGENTYSILDHKIHYRNRFGEWLQVDMQTVFDLQPNQERIEDQTTIEKLDREYMRTPYDVLIKQWEDKNYQGTLQDDFLKFEKEVTSPEEYFNFTKEPIEALLRNPVSIAELERWNGGKIANLEDTIKLCSMALDVVKSRRNDSSHTIYLLRDCMMFYQMHKTLDILSSAETSSDQLMIGRKLLSYEPDKWGYYIVTLEALYEAHIRYPNDFNAFYNEYAHLLDLCISVNPRFKALIDDLTRYIKKHIETNQDKIVIFDTGFQGSINLLTKYVIDRYIKPINSGHEIETEIEVSVGALWSKELFEDRALGYYFPFLNRVQYMAMSDELYHYRFGSLNDGKVEVTMGNKDWQQKAAIEFVVLVMVTQLAEQKE
jgi:hypothetical protein